MRWLPLTEAADALGVTNNILDCRARRGTHQRKWDDKGRQWLYAVGILDDDGEAVDDIDTVGAVAELREVIETPTGFAYDPTTNRYLIRNGSTGAIVNQLPGRVERVAAALFRPEAFAEAFEARGLGGHTSEPPRIDLKRSDGDPDVLVHISTRDIHVGEPGDPAQYHDEIMRLISETVSWHVRAHGRIDRFLVTLGSDWLTVDTAWRTTTKGTQIPGALSPFQVMEWAETLAVEVVDACRQVAPVTCIGEQGNHDTVMTHALTGHVAAWYRHCADVEVIRLPCGGVRSCYLWHDVMIGGHHGHVTKPEQLGAQFAALFPREWGQSRHRYVMCGHRHHSKRWAAGEYSGVEVIQTASPSRETEYEHRNGYTHAPSLESFAFAAGRGLVTHRRAV